MAKSAQLRNMPCDRQYSELNSANILLQVPEFPAPAG
jgi:hypothetical protein